MVIQKILCSHCQGADVKRDGHTAAGKQRYRCKTCGRISRENPQYERYNAAQKEQILRAYNERPSMRGIQRIFGVSRPTLALHNKC